MVLVAYDADIAAVAPVLELTLDYVPASLRCAGTLDVRTRRHVLEAIAELLAGKPSEVTIDVEDLHVTDTDGANAFAYMQRMVREAGVILQWNGLDAGHLRREPARYFPI
jgi:anti-anti-sigma regulatory factor